MQHCFECSGLNMGERRRCSAVGCALWAFRNGYEVDESNEKIVNPNLIRNVGQFGVKIDSENTAPDSDFEPESDSDDEYE